MPRVIDFDDEDWRDLPYTDEDLKKPGFDPFEAHLAWLKRRRETTPQQEARRLQAALARLDIEMAAFKKTKRRRKKKPPSESQASIKLWKRALAEAKEKRKRP